jgi:porin
MPCAAPAPKPPTETERPDAVPAPFFARPILRLACLVPPLAALATAPAAAEAGKRHSTVTLSWTQFLGQELAGESIDALKYGGHFAAEFKIDGRDLGLSEATSFNIYPEFAYGQNINNVASGLIFPPNVGLAYPSPEGEDFDISYFVQQKVGSASLQIGKINNMRRGKYTPMVSGGGLEGFQHTVLASPPSIIGQPTRFGAMATVPIDKLTLSLGVWDPRSAINRSPFDGLFATGVAGYVQLAVPVSIGGKPGNQKLALYGSSKKGLDLNEIPEIILPPEAEDVVDQTSGAWHIQYSFHQYLWSDPTEPARGWGVFGRFGLWDGNPTPFRWQAVLGLSGDGFNRARPLDRFGVGLFRTGLSDTLVEGLAPIVAYGNEGGGEAFYTFSLSRHARLTANIAYVDPAKTEQVRSIFAGLRLKLEN